VAPQSVNDQTSGFCRTILHKVSMSGDLRRLELVLSIPGVDPSIQDGKGNTPLHLTTLCGYEQHTMLLLDAGADSTLFNKDGYTASDLAFMRGDVQLANVIWSQSLHCVTLKNRSEIQADSSPRERVLQLLFSRIEADRQNYDLHFTVGLIYLREGDIGMATQYFDQYTYLLRIASLTSARRFRSYGLPIASLTPARRFRSYGLLIASLTQAHRFRIDGPTDPFCSECFKFVSLSGEYRYLCWTCPSHDVCQSCFQGLSTRQPPKYFSNHKFHSIPSEQYPTSILPFIESFESTNTKSAGLELISEANDVQTKLVNRDTAL